MGYDYLALHVQWLLRCNTRCSY